MKITIGKKIGVGFAVALLALLAIGVITARNLQELDEDAQWVNHTIQVQSHVNAFYADMLHAESTSRGYWLLPDSGVRRDCLASAAEARSEVAQLRSLTADNPVEQHNLARLQPLMEQRLRDAVSLMGLRDQNRGSAVMDARQRQVVEGGRTAMSDLRDIVVAMNTEEERLLNIRRIRSSAMARTTWNAIVWGTVGAFLLVAVIGGGVTRSITRPLRILGIGAEQIGGGDYSHRARVVSRDEVGRLADLFNRMTEQVEERQKALAREDWLKGGLARFAAIFEGQRDVAVLCQRVLAELAEVVDARSSAIYLPQKSERGTVLRLLASHAADQPPAEFAPGEGWAGQSFLDAKRRVMTDIPEGYFRIKSALGAQGPASIVLLPAVFEGQVKAVVELASWRSYGESELALLDRLASSLGVVINVIEAGQRTEALLRQSQSLTESLRASEAELQEQQEELKQANEELEQANEEMQQTNEEMEEKVHLLAEQKSQIEETRRAVEEKARLLEQASRYKSDFLASMSHELRTPLNSMLILSKLLSDNREGALTEKQVQYAQTIYSSGNDLLELINEILDLAKIESGSVQVDVQPVEFTALRRFVEASFGPVAEARKLELEIEFSGRLPESIETDGRRLQQVLKNLLANAFKFTERGKVALRVEPTAEGMISFAVEDSGIGIAPEHQRLIFEAFRQADAGTARKYGGTGLGLSISREIAWMLGGSLSVRSAVDQGSTFTLVLPRVAPASRTQRAEPAQTFEAPAPAPEEADVSSPPVYPGITDDRESIRTGDMVLLVVEDDPPFAKLLGQFAREKGFKVLLARTADAAMALARRFPVSAVTLDLKLPDRDGRVVLDRLKRNPATRHIPVHVISVETDANRSLRQGAISYLHKPVTKDAIDSVLAETVEFVRRPMKKVLIVEDNATQRVALANLIGGADVKPTVAASAAEALEALNGERFDCVVIDLGLPDQAGLDLIREIQRRLAAHPPPIIVYTGKELSREEETELRRVTDSIVVKSARSPERLLEETALFLHRVQAKLPPPARDMIADSQKDDSVLAGRKVLVVDDDVRNIFAITSALEESRMDVRYAESGQAALEMLDRDPAIEAVLMDVMMPEMDGFEAIRRIRAQERFKKLPVISVTAKAMKGDREKCLDAGASDYITKPVDMDQLRSLLRVWLYR